MAALLAAGVMQLHQRCRHPRWLYGIVAAALCALGALTWAHAAELRTPDIFWRAAVRKDPRCWPAWNEIGVLQAKSGQTGEAVRSYLRTIELKPDYDNAHSNLGIAYLKLGRLDDAIAELKRAAELTPTDALRHHQLGNVLSLAQRPDEAAAAYRKALDLQPSSYPTHEELAKILLQQGHTDEAVAHYHAMQKLQPSNPDPHTYLGNVLAQSHRDREAVEQFELALRQSPSDPTVLNNLSLMLSSSSDRAVRNAPRALELAQPLDHLTTSNDPDFLTTLAAAWAENAHFAEASETAARAAQVASDQGNTPLAESLRQRSLQYKAHAPK
jgi:Flp pilus assembly protein TadD